MKNTFVILLLGVLLFSTGFVVLNQVLPASAAVAGDWQAELEEVGGVGYDGTADETALTTMIGNAIQVVLGLLGVVLLVIIIYAGFLWMTAGGEADQVKKAKSWLTNAIIGLAIILAAYAITGFVMVKLTEL